MMWKYGWGLTPHEPPTDPKDLPPTWWTLTAIGIIAVIWMIAR